MHALLKADSRSTARRITVYLLWAALAANALASLFISYVKSARDSMDFQWSGSYLLLHHVDPWQQFLAGGPAPIAHISVPNYAHELYILFLPLGALPFSAAARLWCAVNLLLPILAIFLLGRVYDLDRTSQLLLLLLLWGSLPMRNGLYNGQQAILELIVFALVYYPIARPIRGLALGLSYAKYSFAPVLVPLLLFQRKYRLLAWSLIPLLSGLLLAWFMVGGNLLHLALEPLAVGKVGVNPGAGDLMTIIGHLAGDPASSTTFSKTPLIAVVIPTLLALAYAWISSRRRNRTPAAELACVTVATLLLYRHLIYDYVFLVIPLAYAVRYMRGASQKLVFVTVAFFWYAEMLARFVVTGQPAESFGLQVLTACILLVLLTTLEWDARQVSQPVPESDHHASVPQLEETLQI